MRACERCGSEFEVPQVSGRFAEMAARLATACPACCDLARAETLAEVERGQLLETWAGRRRSSRLPERFFSDHPLEGSGLAWEAAKRFASGATLGLFLAGSVGAGKTTLAGRAFDWRMRTIPGRWRTGPELLDGFSGNRDSVEHADSKRFLRINGPIMLGLDDLGQVRESAYASEQVFKAIDAAYSRRTPLVITSNEGLEPLGAKWPAGLAIVDRLVEHCEVVTMTGPSRRRPRGEVGS